MRALCRSIAVAVATLTAYSSDPVGRSFASEHELLRAVGAEQVVCRLDVRFPARIVRIAPGERGLQLVHGPESHEFPAAPGQRAVFVEHASGRGLLVLRDGGA